MKKWEKLERSKLDIEKGYNLCPKCKAGLERLVSNDLVIQERCSKGCYVYDFKKKERIK